ncbi:hypothetical protein O181_093808 [Austropuccinia psidii MF-1]|uniref:Uncharacterized protein n=1 Tax=Austropuccinia psidii MF-1 TaxID=1389203 RepID=A0A9Q3J0Y3_9BASI|nr:hypothetical protein [Austropuccinia psidii MF-1]
MDDWADWKTPCISIGIEEPLGYAYGLRNTKQRKEQEYRLETQYQPLTSKETIQPRENITKMTGVPGGFIDTAEPGEERVMIPTKYKAQKPLK